MFETVRLSPAFLIRLGFAEPPKLLYDCHRQSFGLEDSLRSATPPGEGTPSASILNPAHTTPNACRVGVQGEGGFWERELTTQRLPLADFFAYFLVRRQESKAPGRDRQFRHSRESR